MASYDFSQLSDYDFECLARDVLQKELRITMESFAKGRDGGIDLRCSKSKSGKLIVQCKHYAATGYNGLSSSIRKEADKVKRLAPGRYILVTSVPMTPHRKDELVGMLAPWCKSPEDIIGREDLNNLLSKFPEVEKSHFKLWLTSTAVLEKVLHSSIFNESISEIEAIKRRMCHYVHNDSFTRALRVLDEAHYCVITGIPGIGKTTLAQMLLAYYSDQDYEIVRVWEGIKEAREVYDSSRRQVFYFDDFLGRTGLDQKLEKNEDERLLRFMVDVARSPNTRFILTTRDYILNQARNVYEGLREARLDTAACLINLQDYTPFIRARILYNHLYFSDLPKDMLSAFADEAVYSRVIKHRNFSPRIIDRMTQFLQAGGLTPEAYVAEFVANLENPARIWEFAYHNHLADAAKNLLLVLTDLPNIVSLDDLQESFSALHSLRSDKYHSERSPYDFTKAIKELEGNFIAVKKDGASLLVEFHNPSVRDFMEAHLRKSPEDVHDLVTAAVFPDQIRYIDGKIRGSRDGSIDILNGFLRTFTHDTAALDRVSFGFSNSYHWIRQRKSPAEVFRWSTETWGKSKSDNALSVLNALATKLAEELAKKERSRDYSALAFILEDIITGRIPATRSIGALKTAIQRILFDFSDSSSLDHARSLVNLVSRNPKCVTKSKRHELETLFRAFIEVELESIKEEDDAHLMIARLEELETLAARMGIDELDDADEIRGIAENMSAPDGEPDDDDSAYEEWRESQRSREHEQREIRSMFQTLADKQ